METECKNNSSSITDETLIRDSLNIALELGKSKIITEILKNYSLETSFATIILGLSKLSPELDVDKVIKDANELYNWTNELCADSFARMRITKGLEEINPTTIKDLNTSLMNFVQDKEWLENISTKIHYSSLGIVTEETIKKFEEFIKGEDK